MSREAIIGLMQMQRPGSFTDQETELRLLHESLSEMGALDKIEFGRVHDHSLPSYRLSKT